MVYYSVERKGWIDTLNLYFLVKMPLEGQHHSTLKMQFYTRGDFWDWYRGND